MHASGPRSGVAFALLGWVSLLAILPGLPGLWSGTVAPYEVLGWLLALFLIGSRIQRNWLTVSSSLAIALLFALSLCIPTGAYHPDSLRPLLLAALMLVAGFSLTRGEAARLPVYTLRVGLVVMTIALLDYLGAVPERFTILWRDRAFRYLEFDRLSATFFHPNLLAWYAAVVWLAGWWLTIPQGITRRDASRGLVSPGMLLAIASLVSMLVFALTLSRAVPLGVGLLVVGAILLPYGMRRFVRRASIEYLVFGAIGFACGQMMQNEAWAARLGQLEVQAQQAAAEVAQQAAGPVGDPEQLGRVAIWKSGIAVLEQSPAWGFGASGYLHRGNGHIHTHNLFIEIAVTGGAVALLLGVLLLGIMYRHAWPIGRQHRLEFSHLVVGMILVTGIFDCFLFFNFPLQITAFAAGILCRPRHLPAYATPVAVPGESRPSLIDRVWTRLVLRNERVAVVGLVCVFALYATIRSEITYTKYALNQPIDFFTYYASTQYVNETGDSPYLVWPAIFYAPATHPMGLMARERHGQPPLRYFYPPTSLIAFTPLAAIQNADVALGVWRIFELFCLLAIVYGIRPLCRGPGSWFTASLVTVLCVHVFVSIYVGQVSLPLGAAAIWAWRLHRTNRSGWAGALVALAASIKIFPVFWLGLVFLRPKGTTRLVVSFVTVCLLLVAATLLCYDHSLWPLYQRWVIRMLEQHPPIGSNISLRGLEEFYPILDMNMFRLVVLSLLSWLWLCGALLAWRGRIPRELSYLGLLSLGILALPLAWPHYMCIPIALLGVQLANALRDKNRFRIFLCLFIVLIVGTDFKVPQPQLICLGLMLTVAIPVLLKAAGSLSRSRRLIGNLARTEPVQSTPQQHQVDCQA